MSRSWLTAERALIALGALILITLFALTRFMAGDPDSVAAVLDSTELVAGPDQDRQSNVSDGTADGEGSNRSTGVIPAPIGSITGAGDSDSTGGSGDTDESTTTTAPQLDPSPDTTASDDETGNEEGDDPPADEGPDEADNPPDTTAPPEDEPDDLPDNGDEDDGDDEDKPTPDPPNPEDEKPENELANTPPTVWLTWSGYALGGIVGRTTNGVTFFASDPDGDPLTFSATGMPPGLTIDPATGTITGTFTETCMCQVTVTVTDGRGGNHSVGFGWTVV